MNPCLDCYTHCVRCLLETGADPNIVGSSCNAAIHFATMYRAHAILHDLLAHSVNYLAKKTNGKTILHLAALANRETIRLLIQHGLDGIDVSALDNVGKSARDRLNEREGDSENLDFKSTLQEFLASLERSHIKSLESLPDEALAESSSLATQTVAFHITRDHTVTCLTPLSAATDDEDYEDLSLNGPVGHNLPVFYDALEEIDHARTNPCA